MKRIGVLLCGAGRDGSEIHESTFVLLSIKRRGALAVCFAPGGPQKYVRNHLTDKNTDEKRDMLVESARIARGDIRDIKEINASDIDALIIPGGQGAATNLSSFIEDGVSCTVHPEAERIIAEMHKAQKSIGAICMAPSTLAKALQNIGVSAILTAGDDSDVARKIVAMGHGHERCDATDCVIDRENRIVTTPAYMNAKSIAEVWEGIDKLTAAVIEMI